MSTMMRSDERRNPLIDYEIIKYETEEVTPKRLCNYTFGVEVSDFELSSSRFSEGAKIKIRRTLENDLPECIGCQHIKVDEQQDIGRMVTRYRVSCGQMHKTQIACKDQTLYRRGSLFSYTRVKSEDLAIASLIPTDYAPVEPIVPHNPDAPTTESDTW